MQQGKQCCALQIKTGYCIERFVLPGSILHLNISHFDFGIFAEVD
jgi:hypothetical protein